MPNMIEAADLSFTYHGGTRALDGVTFEVPEGKLYGLLGPNGAGKTTAIRIFATLLRPQSGSARVGGHDVAKEAHKVRRLIGLTGQFAAVDDLLSGHENLTMIGRLGGLRATAARRRASQLLETFDLADAARKVVKSYSGGMKRRLDVAASLVARPRVLFLDEPTTGLDPRSRSGLWELIRSLVAEGATVLLTTQYLEEADRLAESILVVDHGQIVASGSPDQLKAAVGGQVLEVRTVEPSELATTAGILSGLAGVEATVDRGAQLVTAPIPESALLGVAVRRLDEAKVSLSHLELRRPSLDEVFLTLTGPPGTDGAAAEAAGGADGRTADGAAEPAADRGNGQGERR